MYLGLVMEQAATDEMFDNPLHPYTEALWRSIPTIDGELERLMPIRGTLPSPFAVHKGCPFYSRCEKRIQACATRRARPWSRSRPEALGALFLFTDVANQQKEPS